MISKYSSDFESCAKGPRLQWSVRESTGKPKDIKELSIINDVMENHDRKLMCKIFSNLYGDNKIDVHMESTILLQYFFIIGGHFSYFDDRRLPLNPMGVIDRGKFPSFLNKYTNA